MGDVSIRPLHWYLMMQPAADEEIGNFLEYWRDIRGDRPMPAKGDLDLMHMKKVLAHVSLHERFDRGSFIYRVHGSGLASTAPSDHTGSDLLDYVPEIWREPVATLLNVILDQPCVIREEHILRDPLKGLINRDGLHLPLSDSDGTAKYIFSYYPPIRDGDQLSLATSREADTIREAVGFADIEIIDTGSGIPGFADQIIAMARQITERSLADDQNSD